LKRSLIILALLFSYLYGIVCISADGEQIPQDREYHYYLHNNAHDYSFYGANKWAVRFDFSQAYPLMSNVNFTASGARLWFPNPGGQVTVELCTDNVSQPGSVVSVQTVEVSSQQIDIAFPSTSTHDIAWLVVTYETNMQSRYVAASAGGGDNSFYMTTVGDQFYLSSLSNAGFNCELLFGLLGDFTHTEVDLELCDFYLEGDLLPGSRVYPRFTGYNHSNQTLDEVGLSITMNRPGEPRFDSLYIALPQSLAPLSSFDYTSDLQFIELPSDPLQLRLDMKLISEIAESDSLSGNNSFNCFFNIFADPMPGQVVENFLRTSGDNAISTIQSPYLNRDFHVLDYYPLLSDPLSNLGAMQRFNWYGFNALPQTIGNGHSRIIGLTQAYESSFAELLDDISADRTFISESSCRLDSIPESANMYLSVSLLNQNTSLYESNLENITLDSRLFVGLFAKPSAESTQKYSLLQWICFADTINTALQPEVTVEKTYSVSFSNLFNDSAETDYRIYYWLQDQYGGRIHFMNFYDFDPQQYTSNADLYTPSLSFSAYPNPLRQDEYLHLSIKDATAAKISIYNLKGQRIHRQNDITGKLDLCGKLFPASGIYFIRVEQSGKAPQTKKISIIK
jgi:hypothetical protein